MSIFQKTFVFLHHLCTSGAKSAKNSSVQEPCKIKNKKQDEDITYFTTRQNEVAPLGTAAVAHPRHLYQDDSSLGIIYTYRVYPVIGSLLTHLGIFPFAVGDIFIALSIAWVVLYPIYEMGLRKKLARRFIFLAAKSGGYAKKKAVFGRVIEYLLWVYVWFYAAWGLNYSQPVIYYRVGMQHLLRFRKKKFRKFAYQYADSLNLLSEERRGKSEKFNCIVDDKLKNRVRDAVLKEYNKIGYREGINPPFNQHPHAKTMVFSPISSMSGVTGSMEPFFCEFTLNGDILAPIILLPMPMSLLISWVLPTKERRISTVISSVRHHRIRR